MSSRVIISGMTGITTRMLRSRQRCARACAAPRHRARRAIRCCRLRVALRHRPCWVDAGGGRGAVLLRRRGTVGSRRMQTCSSQTAERGWVAADQGRSVGRSAGRSPVRKQRRQRAKAAPRRFGREESSSERGVGPDSKSTGLESPAASPGRCSRNWKGCCRCRVDLAGLLGVVEAAAASAHARGAQRRAQVRARGSTHALGSVKQAT